MTIIISSRLTCTLFHGRPRAVTIPRAFNPSAICCKLSPASLAPRMIGNTSSYTGPAKASRLDFAA